MRPLMRVASTNCIFDIRGGTSGSKKMTPLQLKLFVVGLSFLLWIATIKDLVRTCSRFRRVI